MKAFINYIFIISFMCSLFFVQTAHSQTNTKKGNWLVSKTLPTKNISKNEKQKRLENFGTLINSLIDQKIIPQALDRNAVGEMLVLSQTAPPAELSKLWIFQAYKSEEDMLSDLEKQSKARLYPTGFDVQEDGAYVLFVKSQLTMKKFRLIKIENEKALSNSLKIYWELGFIPIALSSYTNSIWIMYAEFEEIDTRSLELQVKTTKISELSFMLDEILQTETTQILSFTTLNEDIGLVVFQHHKNKQNN